MLSVGLGYGGPWDTPIAAVLTCLEGSDLDSVQDGLLGDAEPLGGLWHGHCLEGVSV